MRKASHTTMLFQEGLLFRKRRNCKGRSEVSLASLDIHIEQIMLNFIIHFFTLGNTFSDLKYGNVLQPSSLYLQYYSSFQGFNSYE